MVALSRGPTIIGAGLLLAALLAGLGIRYNGSGGEKEGAAQAERGTVPGQIMVRDANGVEVVITPEAASMGQTLILVSPESPGELRDSVERQFPAGTTRTVVRVASAADLVNAAGAAVPTIAIVVDGKSLGDVDAAWLKAQVTEKHVLIVGLNVRLGAILDKLRPESLRWGMGSPDADGGRDHARYYYSSLIVGITCAGSRNGAYGPEAEPDELQRTIEELSTCRQPVPSAGQGG